MDPLTGSYPWYTPYQFAGNMPIWAIDVDGLEPYKISDHTGYSYDESSVEDSGVPEVTAQRGQGTAAKRTVVNYGGTPSILTYKLSFKDYRRLTGKTFLNTGSDWQNFIKANRVDGALLHKYDFVSGPMFGRESKIKGILAIERKRILNTQFSIHTSKAKKALK